MNCKTCKYAIYDPRWTEYKCMKKRERVEKIPQRCRDYEKGTPQEKAYEDTDGE